MPSFFGGHANATLSCLVRRANHVDFSCDTFKYQSINDITRDHDLVKGEVNVSGPEQGIPKYLTQALKSESFMTSQLRLLTDCGAEMSMLTTCELYFGLINLLQIQLI